MALTAEQKAEIDRRFGHQSSGEIAEAVNATVMQVENYVHRAALKKRMPESPMPVLKPMVIDGDVTVISDLHVPYHDARFLGNVLDLSQKWAIPTVLIAGDLFQFDAFSKFLRHPAINTKRELRVGREVLERLTDTFAHVILLEGNHDWRIGAKLDQEVQNEDIGKLFSLAANFTFSDYSRCYHKAGWVIGHPRANRKVRVGLPREFADIECQNAAAGHTHNWGMTRSYNGKYYAVELGHCCDPTRMEYVEHQWKPLPKWNLGAMILKSGADGKLHPYLLDVGIDWEAMGRMYAGA